MSFKFVYKILDQQSIILKENGQSLLLLYFWQSTWIRSLKKF